MNKKLARKILYILLIANILAVIYFSYTDHPIFSIEKIRWFIEMHNIYISLTIYIILLTLRWLTLFPGTPLLIAWVLIFPTHYVIISVEIAILLYTLIIYKYNSFVDFSIPKKALEYKDKIQKYEIPYIFLLCFIPGMSMNGLAYFLSTIKIHLKNILLWMIPATIITTTIYIYLFDSIFDSIL